MAFDESLNPEWYYELPFYIITLAVYLVVFTLNPSLRWGNRESPLNNTVMIEFVAAAPVPTPKALAAPPLRVSRMAPAKPARTAKPAVVSKMTPAQSAARRQHQEAELTRKAAANAEKARQSAVRAERAQVRARAQAEERARAAEKAREAAMARAEAERVERERLAAVRAEKARKKAELSQELATMADPDEALAPAGAAPAISKSLGRKAAAALAAGEGSLSAEPPSQDKPQLLDSRSRKGAAATEPGGVSFSLDGPVGNRRVIERVLPQSPDWVGTRGLDLMVTIRFRVLPDGTVNPGAVIEKTSGFPEIDQLALKAIRQWIFEAAPAGGTQTWGRVVLRFLS